MREYPGGVSRVMFWLYALLCAVVFWLIDGLNHRHWMKHGRLVTRRERLEL